MCRRLISIGWAVLLAVVFVPNASAQQRPRGLAAATSAADAGPDFGLQGEYAGWIEVPGQGSEHVGLQVVALGDGKFEAVRYSGGLPGSGWNRGIKRHFEGQAAGGKLTLTGAKDKFVIADGVSIAQNDAGRELGRLRLQERLSPTLGLAPPPGATVLFNGSPPELLQGAKLTPDRLLQPGVLTKMPVDAFRLHLEFRTPFMPAARGQARGNSGVYVQQRYEVQILDSFGLEGAENECGALYRQTRPDLNMALPPLSWQTYDIWFTPPYFAADGKTKLANARITVVHNGKTIHRNREITAKTGGGKQEGPAPLAIQLQDHGNPVAYRNIWIMTAGDNGSRYYAVR
jgi:3-keto-disaccharide hydrolase